MRTIIYAFLFLTTFIVAKLNAQVLEHFMYNGKQMEIIILPFDYKLPDSLMYINKLKSGDPYLAISPAYKDQLHVICFDAIKAGANVIQITKFVNVKWNDSYNLKAKAYKTTNYEEFKKSVFDKKACEAQAMANFSYVTIYRPNYTASFNDLYNYKLAINKDTLNAKSNSKFKIRVDKEGITEIRVTGTKIFCTIDIKFGVNYYVCSHAGFPNTMSAQSTVMIPISGYIPILEQIEADKGELESSLIKNTP